MKQLLLATALIVLPAAAFFVLMPQSPKAVAESEAASGLGDLTPFEAIVTDVQAIAATGDFVAAEKRVSDFETAWDDAEPELRARDAAGWGSVDDAADAAFAALRAGDPDKVKVAETLGALHSTLHAPVTAMGTGVATLVAGIVVTDVTGHAIPCEEMLKDLTAAIDGGKIAAANQEQATEYQSKATERCNADDDKRADEFSAHGLALASK
jgi:hypothetical protein